MDTDGEKPPEDKGVYRFLGRKDCIFSSPFPARIIPEVIISPSVSPTILFHSRTFSYFDRIIYYRITIWRDQVYAYIRNERDADISGRWRFIASSWQCVEIILTIIHLVTFVYFSFIPLSLSSEKEFNWKLNYVYQGKITDIIVQLIIYIFLLLEVRRSRITHL